MAFGFLAVVLDFRFNGWDILPDAVGYGTVCAALASLAPTAAVRAAVVLSILLTLAALPGLLPGNLEPDSWLLWVVTALGFVLTVLITVAIREKCDAVCAQAGPQHPATALGTKAVTVGRIQLYVGLPVVAAGLIADKASLADGTTLDMAIALLAVAVFAVMVVFLALLFRADAVLAGPPSSTERAAV
jgi:hypothetical protein